MLTSPPHEPLPRFWRATWRPTPVLVAGMAGAIACAAVVGLGVTVFREYGLMLFLASPFFMGLVVGYFLTLGDPQSTGRTLAALAVAFLLSSSMMVMLTIEGVVCLVMAAPLAVPLALMGAAAGAAAGREASSWAMAIGLLVVPAGWGLEAAVPTADTLYEVRSAIEIDAPPEDVWPHVLAFPPLPEPTEWYFKTGLAYPREARIEGSGVGAVRYCVFSTGPFIEPITAWEPARRLAFDVTSSPAPLRELSPWNSVHPPHLDGYLNSRRGEFRLIALPDGRTRLEGSTWYTLDMAPAVYWRWITDRIIGRIHERVLDHIRLQAEIAST